MVPVVDVRLRSNIEYQAVTASRVVGDQHFTCEPVREQRAVGVSHIDLGRWVSVTKRPADKGSWVNERAATVVSGCVVCVKGFAQ